MKNNIVFSGPEKDIKKFIKELILGLLQCL